MKKNTIKFMAVDSGSDANEIDALEPLALIKLHTKFLRSFHRIC